MDIEEARRLMKKEIKPHKHGSAPLTPYSTNKLNAMANAVALKHGRAAALELHKELTSKQK